MTPLVLLARASRLAVAFGPAAPYERERAAAKIGGSVPSKVLLFPAGRWELDDGSLITDAEAFASILANFRRRGINVVFDYEHWTLDEFRKPGELPLAAGVIYELEITPEGLVGYVEWTEKAAQHIAAGEYLYHSPVAIYDKETLRVLALHSCALTNTPRTNHQQLITEQVAAKVIAAALGDMKGGRMQWVDRLIEFLSDDVRSAPDEKVAKLESILAAVRTAETTSGGGDSAAETVLQHLGLVRASELPPAVPEIVAAIGVERSADTAAIVARIAEMKTGVVVRADHEAAIAARDSEIATLRADLEKARSGQEVEAAIAANLDRLSPALRDDIRAVARLDKMRALSMVANILGSKVAELPRQIADGDPNVPLASLTATSREWKGQLLPVSEHSGTMAAAIRAIQLAESCDYQEATRRYHKRHTAA